MCREYDVANARKDPSNSTKSTYTPLLLHLRFGHDFVAGVNRTALEQPMQRERGNIHGSARPRMQRQVTSGVVPRRARWHRCRDRP